MIADLETQSLRHRVLTLLDPTVHELFDLAAIDTDDVIVVCALVQFENRHAALEMMTGHEAGGLELRQHPIHRR